MAAPAARTEPASEPAPEQVAEAVAQPAAVQTSELATAETTAETATQSAAPTSAPARPTSQPAQPLSVSAAASAFERSLLAAPSANYTLQILGAGSEANVQDFIDRNGAGLRQTLGYYTTVRVGRPWYVISYGVFTTRAEAEATLARLPAALNVAGPWVRQVQSVQTELRAMR